MTGLTYKRNGVTLGDLTYTYDAAGRRTSMGGSYARVNLPPALTSATYDAANKLTNWAGTAQTYDLNGNLTGDGTRTYTWDTRDRLTATSGGGQTSSYVYDAFGRRISRTISGSQTAYVHDGHNPVHTGTGSTITGTLLNGGGLDERYGRTVGGANTALLTDALGSLLHIVDAAGATTATYTYEPYGAVTHSGTDNTGFQYTGREVDVGGLMYYRARYYNPRTARFISEDPIGLAGGVNLYGYVGGDPILRTDPTGEFFFLPIVAAAFESGWVYLPVVIGAGWYAANATRPPKDSTNDPAGNAGHDAGARESTRGKHEAGESRRKRDRGGEKGDDQRDYPRRKPAGWKGPWPPNACFSRIHRVSATPSSTEWGATILGASSFG